jgi:hypothetical protein
MGVIINALREFQDPIYFRGDLYRIHLTDRQESYYIQLTIQNMTTRKMQTQSIPYQACSDANFIGSYIGKIITNIWIGKFTPVNVKLTVTTSDLIGELLC